MLPVTQRRGERSTGADRRPVRGPYQAHRQVAIGVAVGGTRDLYDGLPTSCRTNADVITLTSISWRSPVDLARDGTENQARGCSTAEGLHRECEQGSGTTCIRVEEVIGTET